MALPPLSRTLVGGACLAVLATAGYSRAESTPPAPGAGTDVLVVGHDSRAGLTEDEKRRWKAGGAACDCADVIMVVHLSADGGRASVVSIPRDSYVPFAPHDDGDGKGTVTHSGKINAARKHGGPGLLTRTVERATGLEIDHYVEARLKGFVQAVDALGGATVCTRERMRDEHSGLDLEPGRHHLDGGGALRYVRTRHRGHGDIDRVRRQQRLVADIAGRHLNAGTLEHPVRLDALVGEVARGLRPGPGTSTGDLLALGWRARHLRPQDVEFATVPLESISHPAGHWGSAVKWNDARARRLFRQLAADRPLAPADRRGPRGGFDWKGRVAPGHRMDCT